MAEAIGLAASAAGLLSLGLQVYDGIASYIHDFNGRGSDLSAISTRAENLKASIRELQQTLPRITSKHSVGGTAAIPALRTADAELQALKSFLDELQGPPAQSASIRTTIREQKKNLVYPFRRPTLEKLERTLESANSALRTGIQSLELLVLDSIDTSVCEVAQKVNHSHAAILGIESKTESLETSLSSMATSLIPINNTSSSMKNSLDAFMARTNTALADVHEPLRVALPELRDGMTNVSQQLHIVEDGVEVARTSMLSGFQGSHQKMDELINMVSRSTAQSAESVSLINGDFARVQRQLSEIGRILGANETSPTFNSSSVALTRLASKPSVFKDAYDNFQLITADQAGRSTSFEQQTHRQHSDLVLGSQRSCYCQKTTVAQQQAIKFGDFYWIKKTTASQRHLPGCAFALHSTIVTEDTRRTIYTGLRGLLSVALELSISWRSGAGGFSISPNITIRPMVDEAKSPVFRVMTLMSMSAHRSRGKSSRTEEERGMLTGQVLRHAAATIIKLYHTNMCSVYDVNTYGESALHEWTRILAKWSVCLGYRDDCEGPFRKHLQPIAISSIKDMLHLGLPARLFDYSGRSASNGLFIHMSNQELMVPRFSPVLDVLPSLGHDVEISSHKWTVMSLSKSWGDLLNKHSIMSKVFGFGPLSQAIVMRDENRVRKILASKDYDLHEKNVFRQNVFHLAVSSQHPDLLRVILQAALATGESKQFDAPDANGNTALDFAALYSGEVCRNKLLPAPCIDCSCWLPFNILLSQGWQLSPESFWNPHTLLKKSSYSCAVQLIEMIKFSRKELQAEGHRALSRAEARDLRLDQDCVLDGYASNVVQNLAQRGIVIPQIPTNPHSLAQNSIYHDISDDATRSLGHSLWLADLLFKNGFKDVDHKDSFGTTPLMVSNGEHGVHRSAFTLWLLDHGADPLVNWPAAGRWGAGNPYLKAAHMLLRTKMYSLCEKPNFMSLREIALRIAPLELFDGCQCGCVEAGGCGTTKILFRELWSAISLGDYLIFKCSPRQKQPDPEEVSSEPLTECKIHGNDSTERELSSPLGSDILEIRRSIGWDSNSRTPTTVRRLSEFLRHLAIDFCQWDHVSTAALRFLTFEALGMRHTCCTMPKPPELSPEEIVEMQEEDQTMLALLDGLVEEFTMELRNSGDSLERFLCRYWVGRIDKVLDELNAAKMTEEERKATEALRIKWEPSSNESETTPVRARSFAEEIEILEEEIDKILIESVRAGGH